MKHPILSGSGYKLYSFIWIALMFIHGAVLYFNYGFALEVAALDSLVYNLLFGLIVPGLWYIVSFANLGKDELSLLTTHLVAALLSVFLWEFVSDRILQFIFIEATDYIQFKEDTYIWRLFVGLMYYSISVLVLYLIKYYRDMQDRLSRELELQNLLQDAELRRLKSQINPHFIFNSLNSISALTINKGKEAREMVIKLSDFLRYSLGKDNTELNTLEQEIKNVSLYLDIEKVRFGDRLQFDKSVSEECSNVQVPNLILQPIFENAIKYGVYDSTEQVCIHLSCKRVNDFLYISINNNFDKDAVPSKGEGIGLENVKRRLKLVYDRSDLLEINKEENQFTVIVKIPISEGGATHE
jgi:two-component system, LytTR family, sensor kinase